MSRNFPAGQFDQTYLPHKLCNWESENLSKKHGRPQQRTGRTATVVDDKGHLLPTISKRKAAFIHDIPIYLQTPPQWPQENTLIISGPKATMGYKGIPTSYLNTNTVQIHAVEVAGCKERIYQ
eukprot:jgi/Botrbrau1/4941/Bobra.0122s0023.1